MNIQTEIFESEEETAKDLPALTSRIDDIVAARDAALAKVREAVDALGTAYALSKEAAAFAHVTLELGRLWPDQSSLT